MYKRLGLTVLMLILSALVTSCSANEKAYEEISSLEFNHIMPAAFAGNKSLEEAADSIYQQQTSLCAAYLKTYQMTDINKYLEKYPGTPLNKLKESLNNKRKELNSKIAEEFAQNLDKILRNVTDCENKERYIQKCLDDARLFFGDYDKIVNATEEDFIKVNNVLVNYADSTNKFALRVLKDNQEFVMAMAIRDIEYNATAEESFRANITKNNDTIDAINTVFGGLGDNKEYRNIVDEASMTLLVKLLDSVETMTEEERQYVISQLEEIQSKGDMEE